MRRPNGKKNSFVYGNPKKKSCLSLSRYRRRSANPKAIDTVKMVTPYEPHFFKPLLPGFETGVSIPVAFYSKHIHGQFDQTTWTLRSDASDRSWEVQLQEGTLTRGWREFCAAHELRVGDVPIFKLEQDMVFHVTLMGPSCCDIQYTHPQAGSSQAGSSEDQDIRGAVPRPSYSFDYCFAVEVTESNFREDKLDLPVDATACTALNKQCKMAKLVNLDGDAWPVSLCFSEAGAFYYIGGGWRKFCIDNKSRIGDVFGFNVVGDGITPPLMCVFAPTKAIHKLAKTTRRKLNPICF